MRKLVIISHTEHQLTPEGIPVGWAPTVNEINSLSTYFDEIIHVACLEKGKPEGSSIPYSSPKIKLHPIPTFGGPTLMDKIGVLFKAPVVLNAVKKALHQATHVQLRVPMGIGVFLIPYFSFRAENKYIFWIKYANNWGQLNPPIGYWLQRFMLTQNLAKCLVTINGEWPNQPAHCITFENPCLSDENRAEGLRTLSSKNITPPFKLVFAGRLEEAKGITRVLEALKIFSKHEIASLDVLGSGKDEQKAKELAGGTTIPIIFHGSVPQAQVHHILAQSHFLVMPSASEGFPKIAAEAMNFGCIPIISSVGSIPYYLHDRHNAFLLENPNTKTLVEKIKNILTIKSDIYDEIQSIGYETATQFTFSSYKHKLEKIIFKE